MSRALVATVIAVAAAGAAIGCGGSNESGGSDLGALVAHLPTDTPLVDATDVDAAREELGLASDADATDVQAAFRKGANDASLQRLVLDTGIGFAEVEQALQGAGDPNVSAAIDGSQLHAVAGTGQGDIQVTALETSQSFDSIADALVANGFTRDGDVVSAPSSTETIGAVADAGDGVVVLARSSQLATAAASEATGPQQLISLLGSVGQPVRTASLGSECVSGIAAGQTAKADGGTALVTVDGGADAGRVAAKTVASTDPTFDFSAPKADGDQLTLDYSGPAPDAGAPTPLEGLVDTFTVYSAYNCK